MVDSPPISINVTAPVITYTCYPITAIDPQGKPYVGQLRVGSNSSLAAAEAALAASGFTNIQVTGAGFAC